MAARPLIRSRSGRPSTRFVAIDDDVVRALDEQLDELRRLVVDLDEDGLRLPTRCEGWTVADVLLHVAQTNDAAVASLEGRLGEFRLGGVDGSDDTTDVDALAGAAVAAEAAQLSPTEIRDRWLRSADDLLAAVEAADAHARVLWVAGDMAARTLVTTRLAETWIHTVDVASAWDQRPAPTPRLWHIARLAWRTVPHAFARAGLEPPGPVAFELTAPDGSTWSFRPDATEGPMTTVRGTAAALCEVAGQRASADEVGLSGEGPDADAVLALVRTFA